MPEQSTAPPAAPPPAAAPPVTSPRGAAIALLVVAGSIHLLVSSQRSLVWAWEAAALAAAGVVQVCLAVALLVDGRRTWWWLTSAVGTLVAVAWLWTRSIGYPFGPEEGATPPVHWLEVVAVGAGLIAASIAGAVLLTHGHAGGLPGPRFENLALACVAAAAVPGLAAGSWLEQYGIAVGSDHTHAVTPAGAPLTVEQREQLGEELTTARAVALQHPTFADAVAAGLVPVGPPAPGVGVQLYDSAIDPAAPVDPGRPRAWIYASDSPDAPVVGLLYDTVGADAPAGFTGDSDAWHLHAGECVVPAGGAEIAVAVDPLVTADDCSLVDGEHSDRVHWMLRAWVVPGWENAAGTFAHDNAALPSS